MKKRKPRISVIIICYNQENLIKRAIDSVLSQKKYLHELIISDDHSTDKTWDIITKYQNENPDKIKPFQQRQNQGVYNNLQSTFDKANGDIVFLLSGDDALGDQLFKKTCDLLENKEIDYEKDRFCVITNYKVVEPDGTELEIDANKLVLKHDYFALKFRYIVSNRALGESKAIFTERKKFILENNGVSKLPTFLEENYVDIFPFYISRNFYYLDYVGNIYYSKIGISQEIAKNKIEYYKGIIEYCEKIPEYFVNLTQHDLIWLEFHKAISKYAINNTYGNLIYAIKMLINMNSDPLKKYFIKEKAKQLLSLIRLHKVRIKVL